MDEKAVLDYLNELSSDENDTDAEAGAEEKRQKRPPADPQAQLQKDLRKKAVLYYLLERQRREMPEQFPGLCRSSALVGSPAALLCVESFSLADVDLPSEALRMKRADLMAIYGAESFLSPGSDELVRAVGGRSNTGAFTFPLDYHFARYGR